MQVLEKDKACRNFVEKELNQLFPARLIKRVFLVAPPDVDIALFDYATAKRGRCWNYPPYGLGIIATLLREDGLEVRILNLNHEVLKACRLCASEDDFEFDTVWKSALAKELNDFQPDLIGITCMFTQTHLSAVEVCNETKKIAPALPIAVGGVHITNCFMEDKAQAALLSGLQSVDLLFMYEAEFAFQQFIRAVNRLADADSIYQVYFNSAPQKLYLSEKRIPKEKELDIIPAHDLMAPQELMDYGVVGSFFCFKEKGAKITTILSNRGCRGQCTYCSVKNFNGPGVRHRSVESIIAELLILKDKYNIAHVMWLDDDLFQDHKRAICLFHEMTKNRLGITWDCTNGVIALSCTDELIAAAAESGCIGLTIGVESGNPQILKEIKKPGSADSFIKAARVLKKYPQINTRVFLMVGFPKETFRMILDTFNLALEMDLDWYNITAFQPLPNTPLFKRLAKGDAAGQFSFSDVRYNVGPYGKIRQKQDTYESFPISQNPFSRVNLDAVPSVSQLNDIWFYLNFQLNFKRLAQENRTIKLEQHLKYLQNIIDLIAPEDPFPKYFCGYLQKRLFGQIDADLIKKLEECLSLSVCQRKKFDDFNLSIEHLKRGDFPL